MTILRKLFGIVAVFIALYSAPTYAQNTTCSTRPAGDSSNACASTLFVNNEIAALGAGTIANFAALRALAPPSSAITVYLGGYLTAGDGGEGHFTYSLTSAAADNAGTIVQPDSLPATGRWLRNFASERGSSINVRWFGAACGAAIGTNNTAFASAVVVAQTTAGSNLYFPACPTGAFYFGNLSIQDSAISILGDGGLGSRIVGAVNTNTIDMFSNSGCGTTHDWTIRGMYIGASGASGIGLHIKNAGWIGLYDMRADGPTAIKVECASQGTLTNVQGYSSIGPALQVIAGGSNSGPISVNGGQFTNNGGSSPAIVIVDTLGISFSGTAYNVANGTATTAISVDGTVSNTLGSATFTEMHGESNYNTTSTMADYEIGKTSKAGSVKIYGGNSWGLGNGVLSQQDFLRIFDARNVTLDSTIASKLAGTGYTRSMIRVEAGYTGVFQFRNPVADVSGTTYSDATGKCTGTVSCTSGGQVIDSLTLGTPLPATSGGTGKASYAIGDILYADTTTTLARLADIATTNALISGGVGVAPSWGKIGNSTLTNSSTTVNGQTCTLGSTCTVTAAATGITVGTTTVGSGTTTRILYDNAGVLGEYTISGSGTVVAMNTGPTISGPTFTSTVTATGLIKNADLATMTNNTVKVNATSGIASPTDQAMTSCSTAASAVNWTTNTGFGCNTSITANTATTATTATNATNGATVATSTNASFFPLFVASSTNSNQPFNLDSSYNYNPSTKTLTSVNFSGNASTASAATVATTTTITDDTTTNAVMFPTWVTAATGNLSQKVSSTLMTWNPATPQLKIGSGADASTIAGTSVYITNNGLSVFALRDSTNDIETYILSGTASLAGIMGTLTTHPFILRSNNLDRLTISSAGVFTFNTIPAADTATTDSTLCVSTAGVILKGSGALGVCLGTSSARYKHDIVTMGVGLAEIVKLSPKNFFYKKGFGDNGARLQYGFIAEDVVKVLPGVTAPDKDGKPNSVDMLAMVPVLVNAIKQLKADNDNLRVDVLALQSKAKSNAK